MDAATAMAKTNRALDMSSPENQGAIQRLIRKFELAIEQEAQRGNTEVTVRMFASGQRDVAVRVMKERGFEVSFTYPNTDTDWLTVSWVAADPIDLGSAPLGEIVTGPTRWQKFSKWFKEWLKT